MDNVKFGIDTSIDDSGLRLVIEHLTKIQELSSSVGKNVSKSFVDTNGNVVASVKKTEQEVSAIRDQAAAKVQEAESRVKAAKTKGLDEVRQKIFEFEEQTRKLRLQAAFEEDANVKKSIAAQTKKVNTELQLYRSAEKEMMGARTFSEQLEKNLKPPSGKGAIFNTFFGTGAYKTELKNLEKEHKEVMEKIEHSQSESEKNILAHHKQTIEKEIAETKEMNAESKEKSEGGVLGGLMPAGGAGGALAMAGGAVAAGAALVKLFETGEKVHQQQLELQVGFQATGKSEEEAAKMSKETMESSKKLALQYGLTHDEINAGTAAYLKMGGSTDNMAQKQELLIGLANKAGVSMEGAAKMLAKSTDPEAAMNLSRLGIKFAANATQAEKFAIVAQKVKGNLEGLQSTANENPMAKMKEMFSQLEESGGTLVFSVLHPVIDLFSTLIGAIQPLISIIEELGAQIGDIVKQALEPFQEIMNMVSDVIKFLMPVIKVLIQAALIPLKIAIAEAMIPIKVIIGVIKFLGEALTELWQWIDNTLGITKMFSEAYEQVSNVVKNVIEWFHKAVDAVKSVGSTILSLIGIHTQEKKATEDSTEAVKDNTQANKDNASSVEDMNASYKDLLDGQRKQIESSKDTWTRQQSILQSGVENGKALTAERRKQLEDNQAIQSAYIKEQSSQLNEQNAIKDQADQLDATRDTKKEKKKKDNSAREKKDFIAQQKELYDLGEQSLQKTIDNLQSHYDKLKTTDIKGRNDLNKAILSFKATQFQNEQTQEDASLKQKQLDLVNQHLSEEDFAEQSESLQIEHLQKTRDIAVAYGQDSTAQELAYQTAILAQQKKVANESIKIEEDKIKSENDLREKASNAATKELDEKKKLNDKLAEENQKSYDKQKQQANSYFDSLFSATQKNGQDRNRAIQQIGAEQILQLNSENTQKLGILKAFGLKQIQEFVTNKVAELTAHTASETAKTATTATGVATREGLNLGEIASNIANAASSAFSAVTATIRSISEIFPFPLNLALIPVGIASVYGLYKGAKALFKFADGGIVDSPTNFQFGKNGQHSGQMGEAGKEAIIPLHKMPEVLASVLPRQPLSNSSVDQNGQIVKALHQTNNNINALHQTMKQPQFVNAIDSNKMDLSLKQSQLPVQIAKVK